jgi:signal transduction histidine kinase
MSPEENKARVLQFMDEFYHRGNLAALDTFIAPDFVDHTPHRGQTGDRQGFIASMLALREMLATAIPNFRAVAHSIVAEGDLVAVRVVVEGERTGPLFGLPTSAGRLPITAIVLLRLVEGKAIEFWQEQNIQLAEDAAMLQERQRLSRDLHDSVTQSLFSVSVLARAAQMQHEQQAPRLGQTLERVATLAQQALVEMRALLFELRTDAIAEDGLSSALEKLVAAMRMRTDLAITLSVPPDLNLPAPLTEAAFRIVQEALSNTAKHAQATAAEVVITNGDRLLITVRDNGTGFSPGAAPQTVPDGRAGGMGLRFMRERATAAGLALDVISAPGGGTTVRLEAAVT